MQISLEQIDPDALRVVQRLRRFQHQAFLVGGCVRDLLLGRKPKDFDVATSATPNEIRRTFRNCRIIGRRFRLAHVFFGRKIIETATFRANPRPGEEDAMGDPSPQPSATEAAGSSEPDKESDGIQTSPEADAAAPAVEGAEPAQGMEASAGTDGEPLTESPGEGSEGVASAAAMGDGMAGGDQDPQAQGAAKPQGQDLYIRRDNVFGSAEEDARRRDFTINGLFFDVDTKQVIDHVNGLQDLEARLVRTIGDPDIRFREDPVRILRAVKFAARCDLTIEPETYRSMMEHKADIAKCAQARVTEEFYRLLRAGAGKRSFELLLETGLLEVLLPELDRGLRSESPNAKRFWAYLEALDNSIPDHREPPTDAMILATILLPPLRDMLDPKAPPTPNIGQAITDSIAPVLERLKASRRDSEVCRQILLALRYLLPCSTRRRQHRLEDRPFFPDALWLAQIVAKAEGSASEAEASATMAVAETGADQAPPVDEELPPELLVDADADTGRRGRGHRDRDRRPDRTENRPASATPAVADREHPSVWDVSKPRSLTPIPQLEWLTQESEFRPAFLGTGAFGGRWAARID